MKHKLTKGFGLMAALLIGHSASSHEVNYDYLDVSLVDYQMLDNSPIHNGYQLEFSKSLGSHLFFTLGYDNVSAEEITFSDSWENRIKTQSYGFGFRNHLTDHIDVVFAYSKQTFRNTETEYQNNQVFVDNYRDRGKTLKLGLKGALLRGVEWEVMAVRQTVNGIGLDLDELGFNAGVRYRLFPNFSMGLVIEDVGEIETSGVSFRYEF